MGTIGAVWGVTGVLGILVAALYRLIPFACGAFLTPFRWYHWLAWTACMFIMAHAEGYRGFQMQFSPRVVARALYLRNHPQILHVLLAPLFCMGFIHATPRRKIVVCSLTLGIAGMVILVRESPQPWRGIIDGGVAIGLTWGLVSIVWFVIKAWRQKGSDFPCDVPV